MNNAIDAFEYFFDGGGVDDIDFIPEAWITVNKVAKIAVLKVDEAVFESSKL